MNPVASDLDSPNRQLLPDLERVYTDIHAHPELSMQEARTSGSGSASRRRFYVTPAVGKTGVVGVLLKGDGLIHDLVVGRNTFYADGVQNLDLGISKTFKMPFEGQRLTVRADLFNALNHVQWALPSSDLAFSSTGVPNANFGRILGTSVNYSPRTISIMLRYSF